MMMLSLEHVVSAIQAVKLFAYVIAVNMEEIALLQNQHTEYITQLES
jgi:hypothetical protein